MAVEPLLLSITSLNHKHRCWRLCVVDSDEQKKITKLTYPGTIAGGRQVLSEHLWTFHFIIFQQDLQHARGQATDLYHGSCSYCTWRHQLHEMRSWCSFHRRFVFDFRTKNHSCLAGLCQAVAVLRSIVIARVSNTCLVKRWFECWVHLRFFRRLQLTGTNVIVSKQMF